MKRPFLLSSIMRLHFGDFKQCQLFSILFRESTLQMIEKCRQKLQCLQMLCDNYKTASQSSRKHYISSYERYAEQSSCKCPKLKQHHTKNLPPQPRGEGKEEGQDGSYHEEKCIFYKLQQCSSFLKHHKHRVEKELRKNVPLTLK